MTEEEQTVWRGRFSFAFSPWAWSFPVTALCLGGGGAIWMMPLTMRLPFALSIAGSLAFSVLATLLAGRWVRDRHDVQVILTTSRLMIRSARHKRLWITLPITRETPVESRRGGKIIVVGQVDPFVYWLYSGRPSFAMQFYKDGVVFRNMTDAPEFLSLLLRVKDALPDDGGKVTCGGTKGDIILVPRSGVGGEG